MKKHIEEYYGIKVENIEKLGNGQTSDVYKIENSVGFYVLKSHLNKNIASNEFYSLESLSSSNLSPRPVNTVSGEVYIEVDRVIYTLMDYIENDGIKLSAIDYFNLGAKIKSMHSSLSTVNIFPAPDRFDESALIEQIENKDIKALIQKEYDEYIDDSTGFHSIIHGDLGSWNLLQHNNDIYFIDFGEVRHDDLFFDLAAIVESLSLSENDINELLNGYGQNDSQSRSRLKSMRKRWRLRGIIFLSLNELKTEQEIYKLLKD